MKTIKLFVLSLAFALPAAVVSAQEPTPGQIVDLGLSVKWAGWNIGASSPEEMGGFYAWGETETKETYVAANYKYYHEGHRDQIIKYCCDNRGYNGFKDGISVLLPEDDVATVKWGEGWRMPTSEEIQELRTKCKWTYITYKGADGWLVKAKNGNSIFLPHTGTMSDRGWADFGSTYPACNLYPGESWGCDGLYFVQSAVYGQLGLQRENGRAIRAVRTGK